MSVDPKRTSKEHSHAACRPAANSFTASVVSGLPPMPHSPLLTSKIFTHVAPRRFSPAIETMASVSFSMTCFFLLGVEHVFDQMDIDLWHCLVS
jgi:hypothetical protein